MCKSSYFSLSILKILTLGFFLSLGTFPFYAYSIAIPKEPNPNITKSDTVRRLHLNQSASYYRALGSQYQNLGNSTQAIKNYEYSILLDTDCGICYFKLGEIYYQQELHQEAIVNLKMAISKSFDFVFDKIKAKYLLAINYFYQKNDAQALSVLTDLINEYQTLMDKEGMSTSRVRIEYYAPAFFLINLYNFNNKSVDKDPKNLIYLHKNLELHYNNAFINYFLYSYYKDKNILNMAFEYLTQAKIIDQEIEKKIKTLPWIKNYDIFNMISNQ